MEAGSQVAVSSNKNGCDHLVMASLKGLNNPTGTKDFGNQSVFDLGTALAGRPASDDYLKPGEYSLCWAQGPEGFLLWAQREKQGPLWATLGTFTLHGPEHGIEGCTLGQVCHVQLPGPGLAISSKIRIPIKVGSPCGENESFAVSFDGIVNPVSLHAASAAAKGGVYKLGEPSFGTVGMYSMCWAHAEGAIVDAAQEVDIGYFPMAGPVVKQEFWGCTLGLPCTISLQGFGFEGRSFLGIVTSADCNATTSNGLMASFGGIPNPTVAVYSPTDDGHAESELMVPKGYFVLAWDAGGRLTTVLDISNAMVDMSVRRPVWELSEEIRSWTLAQLEAYEHPVEYLEFLFNNANRLAYHYIAGIMESFLVTFSDGFADWLASIVKGSSTRHMWGMPFNEAVQQIDHYYNKGIEIRRWLHYKFGVGTDGVPGLHSLCWAAGRMLSPSQALVVPVGSVNVVGPAPRTNGCTLGLQCDIDVYGEGLVATNQLAVSGKCGSVAPSFSGLTNPQTIITGLNQLAPTGLHAMFTQGLPLTGPPGFIRLCWAHDPKSVADIVVDVGVFVLSGPAALSEQLLCTMQHAPCVLTLTGVGLSTKNRMWVLTRNVPCGSTSDPNAGAKLGFTNPQSLSFESPLITDRAEVPFGMITDVAREGERYHLCWANDPTAYSDYKVAVGNFAVAGPVRETHQCTLGEPCAPNVRGYRISAACTDEPNWVDKFNNPCETYSALNWCTRDGKTDTGWESPISIAAMAVNGMSAWEACCACGTKRHPAAEGRRTGLLAMNEDVSCEDPRLGDNDTNGSLIPFPTLVNPQQVTEGFTGDSPNMVDTFQYGRSLLALPSDKYRLCWGFAPQSLTDYRVAVGILRVTGPYEKKDEPYACTTGRPCTVTLLGIYLESINGLTIVESGECGDPQAVIASFEGVRNPIETPDDGRERPDAQFPFKTPMSALAVRSEPYLLCWGKEALMI
jgi:hypothetical protein